MLKEDIEGQVRDLMRDHWGLNGNPLDRNETLTALNVDSLDVVELVMAVEEEFNVQIPDSEIDGKYVGHMGDKTVGHVLDVATKYALPQAA